MEHQLGNNLSLEFILQEGRLLPETRSPTQYSLAITLCAASIFAILLLSSIQRRGLPKNAPPLWRLDDWPILGALYYYKKPNSMIVEATNATLASKSRTGAFSFFLGKKHIVSVGNTAETRSRFFENKDISLIEGTAELLTALPLTKGDLERFGGFFLKTMNSLLRHENLSRILPRLTDDARHMCAELSSRDATVDHPEWRVMNPFDNIYRCIYQLTMRTVSADEVAESRALGDYTLAIFHSLQQRNSTPKVYIPWLPVPGHYLRMWDGFRLYRVFRRILQKRKMAAKSHSDAFQTLIDSGANVKDITGFVLNALFGGQVSTGVNAGWLPVFLNSNPDWKSRAVAEVDGVIARHRTSPEQRPADVLASLPLAAWQSQFPLLADYCLKESARLTMRGVLVRKNTSGGDVIVGNNDDTTEVLPDGAFSIYHPQMTHYNPEIYANPEYFDPGRYEKHRAEDKKAPFVYVGWGAGRHPCVGARFAKLEVTIVLAYFLSHFDFELAADIHGTPAAELPPLPDYNAYETRKPDMPIYLRYKPRSGAL